MFDFPHDPTPVHHFISEHAERLQNAALLLGGRTWLRRTQRLLDHMRREPRLTRHMARELLQLRGLLNLDNVHDLERPEAEYFADLDPAAPYVAELCLLAEAFDDACGDVLSIETANRA